MTSRRARSLLVRVGGILVLSWWGCSDIGEPIDTPCVTSPSSLDFGMVTVGTSRQQALVVRNQGSADMTVNVSSLCGTGFDVINGGGLVTLSPGETHTITVRFAPQVPGELDCDLTGISECAAVVCRGLGVNASTVSFAADVQPIFDAHCIGCHRQFGEADLDLRTGLSYGETVGQVTRSYAPAVRVKPADLDGSVLFQKITGTGAYGGVMPPPGLGSPPVTPEGIEIIRAWILEGALNN
jgi:ASPM-SPD-2-Hydin domain-containing protein